MSAYPAWIPSAKALRELRRRGARDSRRDVYLSEAQVRRLAASADPLTADMIWFAALTGLRRGEMLALRPDQIRGDVLVLESTTKSGRPRGIPMPPGAARIARKRLPSGVPEKAGRQNCQKSGLNA